MTPTETLQLLKSTTGFTPLGEATGNLTLGRGTLNERPVHIALVENKIASGSIGVRECDKLASLFRIVGAQKTPLLLYLDCAGARVSEGLPALGAFRHMYRAALEMTLAGAPMTALLGTHCYGGASMLAALAQQRVFSANTQLAMSGPTILAAAAGVSALDESFRAIASAGIGAAARAKLSPQNVLVWDHTAISTLSASPGSRYEQHQKLATHPTVAAALALASSQGDTRHDVVQRKDVAALYPLGYQGFESTIASSKVFFGKAKDVSGGIRLLGLIDKRLLGAARTWALADRVWALGAKFAAKGVERVNVLVDCEAHSAQLDDERAMLSCYLADLSIALMTLAKMGAMIETTVLGRVGGGVYVALAAASHKVNLLHGADIQLLPSKAVASILGDADAAQYELADYVKARVADDELKVGYLRD